MYSKSALIEQLTEKKSIVDGIASEFKADDQGRFDISTEKYGKFRKAVNEVKELKGLIDDLDAVEGVGNYLDAPTSVPEAARDVANPEFKSLGDMFVNSSEYKAYRQSGRDYQRGDVLHTEMEGKSIYTLAAGQHTVPALGHPGSLGITEAQRRKWHVRDLFPKSSTKQSVLYGVRETGFTNNAKVMFERDVQGAKGTGWNSGAPESEVELTPVMYPVAEIAHMLTAHKNILADEPRLKTFLNTRGIEGVKFQEDKELLFGTAGAESITGITNTEGVQAYTGLATDKYSIQLRRAVTKSLLAEYDPTGVVVSPEDWEELEIETDDNGAFRVAIQVAIGAEKRIWRLNVVETTAMAKGKFLMGAFGLGAQLHDRENVSVQVSSEHGENFSKGLVSLRCAERVALEVTRPESFVYGTLTAPAAGGGA